MKAFTILLVALFSFGAGTAQTASEKLRYLKENIRVWILPQANTDTPDFRNIKTESIYLDTDTIIFGKTSNNGLGQAALLMSALFKDATKRTGGDQRLQDFAYSLLSPLKNPIDLYFINDIFEQFDFKYAGKYGFYVVQKEEQTTILDAVFKPEDPITAGSVTFSGLSMSQRTLQDNKGVLIYSFAKLFLKDFSYLDETIIATVPNKNPPSKMYTRDPMVVSRAHDDMRNAVTDAIAYSFRLHFDEGAVEGTKSQVYYWLGNGPYFTTEVYPPEKSFGTGIPASERLNTQIRRSFSQMIDTGKIPTNPPFAASDKLIKRYKLYMLIDMPNRLFFTNKIVFASYCELYMKQRGIKEFIETLEDPEFIKSRPENKAAALVESLCLHYMGTETFSDAKQANRVSIGSLLPLALLDLFLGFPTENQMTTNLSKFDGTFYGTFPPNTISIMMMEEYFRIRPRIYELASKANRNPDITLLNSGYENILRVANAIKEIGGEKLFD